MKPSLLNKSFAFLFGGIDLFSIYISYKCRVYIEKENMLQLADEKRVRIASAVLGGAKPTRWRRDPMLRPKLMFSRIKIF